MRFASRHPLFFCAVFCFLAEEAPALPEQSRSPRRVESSRPGFAARFPRGAGPRGAPARAGASHERASLPLFFLPLGGDRQSGASIGKSPTGDRLTHRGDQLPQRPSPRLQSQDIDHMRSELKFLQRDLSKAPGKKNTAGR